MKTRKELEQIGKKIVDEIENVGCRPYEAIIIIDSLHQAFHKSFDEYLKEVAKK
jgi:hypothetical protein